MRRGGPPPTDEASFGNAASRLLELCPVSRGVASGLAARELLFDARLDGWGELLEGQTGRAEGDGAGGAR